MTIAAYVKQSALLSGVPYRVVDTQVLAAIARMVGQRL